MERNSPIFRILREIKTSHSPVFLKRGDPPDDLLHLCQRQQQDDDRRTFEVNGDTLRVVSLDGHRMAIRKIVLKDEYESTKVIVPGKTLNEISKILTGDNEKEVQIFFGANHILFEFDDTIVVSRLIEGEYFKVDQMLSSDYATKVSLNKKDFLDSIERAIILIREK